RSSRPLAPHNLPAQPLYVLPFRSHLRAHSLHAALPTLQHTHSCCIPVTLANGTTVRYFVKKRCYINLTELQYAIRIESMGTRSKTMKYSTQVPSPRKNLPKQPNKNHLFR